MKKLLVAVSVMLMLAGCGGRYTTANRALEREFIDNVGDRVHFAFDSSSLDSGAKSTLRKQANWLKAHPQVRVTVQGHCDIRGTREYNLGLGERRAHSAKRYLEAQGINSDRLETISYGKERPMDLGTDAGSHAKNRRAVTALQ